MSKQHSVTKPNRRNKSGKRKDFTRGTMLALRSPENTARATQQAQELKDSERKPPTTQHIS